MLFSTYPCEISIKIEVKIVKFWIDTPIKVISVGVLNTESTTEFVNLLFFKLILINKLYKLQFNLISKLNIIL